MTIGRLWAGWRSAYVGGDTAEPGCVLCRIATSDDEESNIIWRGEHCFCVLNAYPYTSGHVMVTPYNHIGELDALTPGQSAELWFGTNLALQAIKTAYRPGGINVGANLGEAAGAGVPDHLHMHVLPRWAGDTNFATSVAEVRVLPEDLPTTARRLREAWPTPIL